MTKVEHDYANIEPPAEKDPKEYDYIERRADVLDKIFDAGSPRKVNRSELGRYYGVHRNSIYNDMDVLSEFIQETLGKDAQLRTQSMYEKVVSELMEQGKWREAWLTTTEWNEWLEDRGVQEKEPDKIEADVTTRQAGTETDAYEIVGDDDEIVADESDHSHEVESQEDEAEAE